jgi:urease accessory protein
VNTASLHQRATGHLLIDVKSRDGITALADLRQEGCMKARFPRPTGWMEAVTLNSSGGIAGGDRVSSEIHIQPGAKLTIAAQAAERFYRALPQDPPANIRTRITIADNASAEWLPQDSILFDRCALDRVLEVDIAETASFLGLETLVFGRAAMGETIATARLSDTIRIRHGGKLILHDAIRINGDIAATLAHAAVAAGHAAIATIILVAPDATSKLVEVREVIAPYDAGASTWGNLLVVRLTAPDSATMRTAIAQALAPLRQSRALPRVWNC